MPRASQAACWVSRSQARRDKGTAQCSVALLHFANDRDSESEFVGPLCGARAGHFTRNRRWVFCYKAEKAAEKNLPVKSTTP